MSSWRAPAAVSSDAVLVWKLDRRGRSVADLVATLTVVLPRGNDRHLRTRARRIPVGSEDRPIWLRYSGNPTAASSSLPVALHPPFRSGEATSSAGSSGRLRRKMAKVTASRSPGPLGEIPWQASPHASATSSQEAQGHARIEGCQP